MDIEFTAFENALFSAISDLWQDYMLGKEINITKWVKEHSAELSQIIQETK